LLDAMTARTYKLRMLISGAAHGAGGWSCSRSERLQPFADARDADEAV
jgi:hypothetical protein